MYVDCRITKKVLKVSIFDSKFRFRCFLGQENAEDARRSDF